MLYNMAGRPFEAIHIQYIYPLLPIIAYFVLGASPQVEIMVTRSCFVLSLGEFFLIVARVSLQYMKEHKIQFFTIKTKQ